MATSKERDSRIIEGVAGFTTKWNRETTILTVWQAGFPIAEESLLAVAAEAYLVVDTRRPAVASRCSYSTIWYLIRCAAI